MSKTPDAILLSASGQEESEIKISGRHDADAFVEIGSVTKTFTAALLHVLAEAGQVGLDDPVSDHLPVGVEPGLTLRHLAEHTSGLPRLPPGIRVWRSDPYARLDASGFEALLKGLGGHLRTAPGEEVEYSNFGYGVLGAALAAVAGTSWIEAVRHHVVAPLDLGEAVLLEAEVPRERRLVALDRKGRPRATWTLGPLAPAGGLWTTPRALAVYTRKVLVDRALGTVPVGWQHTGGVDWHNGATRDAAVFVGATPSQGRWAVCHGFALTSVQVDGMGLRAVEWSLS